MTLWRLELARMVRTRGVVAVAGTYLFFGLLGPLTARYMEDLLRRFGGGVTVDLPPPVPADGIVQYSSNAQQIGLLVALVVAAGAVALDGNAGMATFLRTRVPSTLRLLLPRFVVAAATVVFGFSLGALAAWYQSTVLLGPLPAGRMLLGIALGALYLSFAVAVGALAGAVVRGRAPAVVTAVVFLLSLPLLALLPGLRPWLPSHLVGALDRLAAGGAAGDYLRAAVVAAVATVTCVVAAARLLARREI